MKQELTDKLIELDVFEAIGLKDLPQEDKMKLLETFSETVFQAIVLRISTMLMGPDLDRYQKMLEEGEEEELGKFLSEKIPNIESIAIEESIRFKKALIERAQELDEMMAKDADTLATAS